MPFYQIIQLGVVVMELLACLAGVVYWKKFQSSYLRWFIIYLAVIVVCETSGLLLLYSFGLPELSRSLYDYFVIPLEFLFFCWLYYQYFKIQNNKLLAFWGGVVYIGCWLFNLVYSDQSTFWSIPLSYLAGVIVLLTLAIVFFNGLLSGNEILDYKQNPLFWISVGVLSFYLISSPFFGLRKLLFNRYRQIFWVYYYLTFIANYMMYILFSIALIWGKPR